MKTLERLSPILNLHLIAEIVGVARERNRSWISDEVLLQARGQNNRPFFGGTATSTDADYSWLVQLAKARNLYQFPQQFLGEINQFSRFIKNLPQFIKQTVLVSPI
ncbi:hypothetical protein [Lapidilactobacillus luobeiensis]|uniref:hypothetical protein n=1 Tax=Lapidilactobacillus luobeiensis TaxID=2950371 RepID=UPI0021C3AD85|nr:hypothetical protein [Lapidilactobacillus luobeiensis]